MKLLTLILFAATALGTMTNTAKADPPSVHGMFLFGKNKTYVSHLPMFHSPHDYQVILEISLVDLPRMQTVMIYEQLKAAGEEFFTIAPDAFDLTKIIDGSLTSFLAKLYSGHFERDGEAIGLVKVQVSKIIYAAKLNGNQDQGDSQDYLLFGQNSEYYAAHVIKAKPSFDTILAVSQPTTVFYPCNMRACPPKLMPDEDLPIIATTYHPSEELVIPSVGDTLGSHTNADVLKVLYLEEGELSH